MTLSLIALVLSVSGFTAAVMATLYSRRHVREAYRQGYAYACARAVGAVAAELGPGDPLVDRMIDRLGAGAPPQ